MADPFLRSLQDALRGFQECAYSLKQANSLEPTADSRMTGEVAEVGERAFSLERGYACAFLQLTAAEDHLVSLSKLLETTPISPFGIPGLARSAIETSARAAWFLEVGIDARTRLGRALAVWLNSLGEECSLKAASGDTAGVKQLSKQIQETVEVAKAAGVALGKDRWKRPMVKEEGMSLPTSTSLIAGVLARGGRENYSYMSASTHGTPYALLENYDFSEAAKGKPKVPRISAGLLAAYLGSAATAFGVGFKRQSVLYGWDVGTWNAWCNHAIGVFLEPMKAHLEANPIPETDPP